ncbi:ribonuclease P protein subunit p25-like protein, partial [Asbolus verrucosus]
VRGSSKIRHLLSHALNEFPSIRSVVWTGFGQSVGKAVTCAELMKREYDNKLHQITKLCHRKVEEFWDPVIPELDQLVVTRNLPMIHIYLTLESLDSEEL